jgi:predicted metalloprotease
MYFVHNNFPHGTRKSKEEAFLAGFGAGSIPFNVLTI